MSLSERAAYLRGLYDGMELNAEKSKDARMMKAIIDVIEEMANHVAENEESIGALADQMDDMAELVDLLQEAVMGEDTPMDILDDDEYEDEDDEEFVTTFEVECPNCQKLLTIDEEVLSTGEIECPTCGQRFQIDLEFTDDEEADSTAEDEIPF